MRHALHFLAHEDEAQHTGVAFTPAGSHVSIQWLYAFPEYQAEAKPQLKPVAEARQLWRTLVASGDYVPVKS